MKTIFGIGTYDTINQLPQPANSKRAKSVKYAPKSGKGCKNKRWNSCSKQSANYKAHRKNG